ncbi:MAG: SPOR domain-containing protein [Thermoanaerobaculia bacterium]
MAESHEPSYYEIALTNRQVVVAFVVLLTCLLGAFFSGVWIGRESTSRNAQEQLVRNTPPSEASQEGKNLEELEFFDKNHKKAAGDRTRGEEAAAPAPGGSTLLEDLGGKKPAARNPPPPAAEPAGEEPATDPNAINPAQERRNRRKAARAAAAAEAAENALEAPAPVKPTPVKPAPVKATPVKADPVKADPVKAAATKATATKTTTKAAAAPAIPKGSYVIQVFSSADQTQADRIRAKLSGGGQKAYLSPISRGGRTMYRVRIGPFKSHDDAQKVADQVRKGYKMDTWVTE